jgi:hypothetical protein
MPRAASVRSNLASNASVRGWAERKGHRSEARCVAPFANEERTAMNLHLSVGPLIALIAGILILVMPRLLNYIVALYLIVIGLLGLLGTSGVKI